jgi:hypothetical protein
MNLVLRVVVCAELVLVDALHPLKKVPFLIELVQLEEESAISVPSFLLAIKLKYLEII